jgi:hypothetical protein
VLKPGVVYEPGGKSYVETAIGAEATTPSSPRTSALPAFRFRLLGVFDSETGDPIPGADVIDTVTGTKARTTATGTVTLVFLPEGSTPVRISKDGYENLSLIVKIAADQLDPLTLTLVKQKAAPSTRPND